MNKFLGDVQPRVWKCAPVLSCLTIPVHMSWVPPPTAAIWISVAPTSWKSESNNVSLVVLDKMLFGFYSHYPFREMNQAI